MNEKQEAAGNAVKERPILFSGPMVRALLDGSKTQTRRVVKPMHGRQSEWLTQESINCSPKLAIAPLFKEQNGVDDFGAQIQHPDGGPLGWVRCPYGQPGDRLWVKEEWQALHKYNGTKIADIPADDRHWANYPASGNTWDAQRRAARFMPRWASRILLEIVSVRVERLQDISHEDALAEGIERCGDTSYFRRYPAPASTKDCCWTATASYRSLWESINGPGSWAANPWVWVVEFKRVAP